MKKVFSLMLIFLMYSLPLAALQADSGADIQSGKEWGFSYAPIITRLYGESQELVLASSDSSAPYTSQLIWELDSILLIGAKISVNWRNQFFFNVAAATALNRYSGEMNDYDWLYDIYPTADQTTWTNWSESDIFLESSFLADLNVAYRYFHSHSQNVDFLLGYKMIHWSWTDKMTAIDYPYETEDYSDEIGENGIDYEVEYRIPYLGAAYSWSKHRFQAGLVLRYSPLASADDHDFHISRSVHFYDSFSGAQYLGLSLISRYRWPHSLSLSAGLDLEKIFETVGNTSKQNDGSSVSTYYPDSAGISYQTISFNLALEYNY